MLRTKLAQRLNSEFTNKLHLPADHAGLLAAGIDNGTLKASQARMIAGLSADWGDAALLDAASGLQELSGASATTLKTKQENAELVAVTASLMSMAESQGLSAADIKSALIKEVGIGYEKFLTASHKAQLASPENS